MSALIIALALFSVPLSPATTDTPAILSVREQAAVMDSLLGLRLETLLPGLMRREGIDMWLIIAREYNEDPVIRTMLPATWHAARRRTMLLFHDRGPDGGVERIAVARYNVGSFFTGAWDPEKQPDQWKRLAELIAERNPRAIGVNISEDWNHADGLTKNEYDHLMGCLAPALRERVVSAEKLAVSWLETRIAAEMPVYEQIMRIANSIIAEGLSDRVITPGVTTTADVQWWYRERVRQLKLDEWFHPSVDIQRAGGPERDANFAVRAGEGVILPGDMLHIDFGITYLRLNTDTQQLAYVLKPGETDAPEGLRKALAIGNRLQDILTHNFSVGRTGNEVLAMTLKQARDEGIKPHIYSHPLGYHGHAAGTTIGMWDNQGTVPGDGDWPLHADTAYAIELNATVAIPEWDGMEVRIMLEESAFFDGTQVRYLAPRQTQFYLIPR